jgi:hypothetical protein
MKKVMQKLEGVLGYLRLTINMKNTIGKETFVRVDTFINATIKMERASQGVW